MRRVGFIGWVVLSFRRVENFSTERCHVSNFWMGDLERFGSGLPT